MSASAIADALVTMYSAASAFGSRSVGKDYAVLEAATASGLVIGWQNVTQSPQAYGSPRSTERLWTFALEAFAKDTGANVNPRTLAVVDTVLNVIKADDTLQGTVTEVISIVGARSPGEAFTVGGATWLRMNFELQAREWPDG